MAKVIFTGVIVKESVKQNNETTFFRVSENTGSKDSPQYNYFDCSGRFSEKQREYIRAGMVVEIVGALNIIKREHEGKTFFNNNVFSYHVDFKGDTVKENSEAGA